MTSITIYDGAQGIGGNKILVGGEEGNLLLDFGKNFGKYGVFYEEFLQEPGLAGHPRPRPPGPHPETEHLPGRPRPRRPPDVLMPLTGDRRCPRQPRMSTTRETSVSSILASPSSHRRHARHHEGDPGLRRARRRRPTRSTPRRKCPSTSRGSCWSR